MITKVIIKDNKKSPISYISTLKSFKNNKEFIFKPGINIIIGKNGSGKSTLLKLIEKYLLIDVQESVSKYRIIKECYDIYTDEFCDGIDVYADYTKNTFRMNHINEKDSNFDSIALTSFHNFGVAYETMHSSTGEGVNIAVNSLFKRIFSKETNLKFPIDKINKNDFKEYLNYVENHKVNCENEFTLLMDEPDRNLDIDNIDNIKGILSFHKEMTQIIMVIHNPLLIYWACSQSHINIIELSRGYKNHVCKIVNSLIKK